MASILILEDSNVLLTKLTDALKERFPQATLLPCKTVAEAQDLLSEFEVQVFLLDIILPDGNGIDFLCDAKTIYPNAQAILMTANPLPELEAHAKTLNVLRFFPKPLDMTVLLDAIAPLLQTNPTTNETSADSFQASLGGLTTIDIIQLKCLSRATRVIRFTLPDGTVGKLHFQRGEIVHADTSSGLSGLDAFNKIVAWKGGRVEESTEPIAPPSIQQGWESLLMDAVRMIDEAAALPR